MFQIDRKKSLVRRELIPFVLTLNLQTGQEGGLQDAEHLEAGKEHHGGRVLNSGVRLGLAVFLTTWH